MPSKRKSQQFQKRRRAFNLWLWPVIGMLLLGCIAYANSIGAPLVFDDLSTIQRNPGVRFGDDLNPFGYIRTRSLLYFTFAFNYWLGDQNVRGYHIVNVLFHIVNSLLIFAIGLRVLEKILTDQVMIRWYAFLAAAFFMVHPIQTESVTYISSRSELLSTFFYLAGFLFFIILPENRIGLLASLVIALFLVLGFGSKETVITLPAVILLYDYLFIARRRFSAILTRWRFYASFLAIAVLNSYYLLSWQVADLRTTTQNLSPWYYFLTEQRVILRYLRLLVWPTGLNLDYDFPLYGSLFHPQVLFSVLMNLSLVFAAWRWREKKPILSFSIGCFFITLSPTSTIVPIPDWVFEHRLYLPLAFVCLSFPFALEVFQAWAGHSNVRMIVGYGSLVVAALLTATILRNEVWNDEVRLWSDVVTKSPHKLRAYNSLIYAHMKRGEDEQAIAVAKLGSQNVPNSNLNFSQTLGNLHLRLGRLEEAVADFKSNSEDALRAGYGEDYLAGSFNNLGVAYMALAKTLVGDTLRRTESLTNARESFQKSLAAKPDNVEVLDSLVNINRALGDAAILELDLRRKLDENPRDIASLYSLAALLSLEEKYRDSVEYFQRVDQAQSSEVFYFNYAFALSKLGQTDRAIEKYSEALRIDPLFNEAHYNLALLHIQKGDYDTAVAHLVDVLRREPSHLQTNLKLSEIYLYQGKVPLARQYLQQVLQVSPQNPQALGLLQKIGASQ